MLVQTRSIVIAKRLAKLEITYPTIEFALQHFANLCGKRILKSRTLETTGQGPRVLLSEWPVWLSKHNLPSLHSGSICLLPTMSESDQPAERQYAFTVALTVYSALKQSSKSKSTTTKWQEKSIKTKELFFLLNKDNYIKFLGRILEKHGQTQYRVSSKQWFSFKFTMPMTKRYNFLFLLLHCRLPGSQTF